MLYFIKNILYTLVFFSAALLNSCKDEETSQNNDNGTFVASVKCQSVDFSSYTSAYLGDANGIDAKFLSVESSDNAHSVDIILIDINGPGTYDIGIPDGTSAYYDYVPGGNGQVTSYVTN
jgi:hypothetical protein